MERRWPGVLALLAMILAPALRAAAPPIPVTSAEFEPVPIEAPADPPAIASQAASEPPSGLITGRVEAEHQLPIEGALVELTCSCLDAPRVRVTNARGIYVFTELPPGEYTVSVFTDVAAPERSRPVSLADGDKLRVNFVSAQPSTVEPLVVIEPSVMTSVVCSLGPKRCKCRVITEGQRRRVQRRERRAQRRARE